MKKKEIDKKIKELQAAPLDQNLIAAIIQEIQRIVDELVLKNFTSINTWVEEIDYKVEEVLVIKYLDIVNNFATEFINYNEIIQGSAELEEETMGMIDAPTQHQIILRESMLLVEPPLN